MTTSVVEPKVGFGRTLHAEWIKLRSLRSTWYTLACLFAVGLGITALAANGAGQAWDTATEADRLAWDPTGRSLMAYIVAQLIVGVLGILVVTSEYATGLMGTTLTATPRRTRVLAAKVVLATAIAAVAGELLMFGSFLTGQSLMTGQGVPTASLSDPGVFSAVTAGGLYLAAIALLAIGLGVIMRATAGALATLVGIVFLVPAMAGLFPSWMTGLFNYWPTLGGSAALTTVPSPDYPHPWLNLAGMGVGIAAVLAAAFTLFRRRDI
ncbi:ABC transporter permease [Actinoplanes sp. TRM 88003]|uniref:ABC transporter permease n=1 Tax=Paractinoplanes aksuensis TaxID=2939490 RepID=A0ABT1DE13_9ACTN|nr:ABC transporter permease [Actinoplanes aksuensis]MCO8269042.1 ABC transporter permease [Actinoplanes aksuensis]